MARIRHQTFDWAGECNCAAGPGLGAERQESGVHHSGPGRLVETNLIFKHQIDRPCSNCATGPGRGAQRQQRGVHQSGPGGVPSAVPAAVAAAARALAALPGALFLQEVSPEMALGIARCDGAGTCHQLPRRLRLSLQQRVRLLHIQVHILPRCGILLLKLRVVLVLACDFNFWFGPCCRCCSSAHVRSLQIPVRPWSRC